MENELQELKVQLAIELFKCGLVERIEVFRLEIDLLLGEDSGHIKIKENKDFTLKNL